MHEQAAGGGAALAGGAHRSKERRRQHHIQIRVVHDDQGVVATAIKDALAEARAHLAGHQLADGGGAGEGDQGQSRVLHHGDRHVLVAADHETAQGAEALRLEHWPDQVDQGDGAQGGVRLGFQTQASPQVQASMEFQAQTAMGKLKADRIPKVPSGCHCSRKAWPILRTISQRGRGMLRQRR